MSCNNCGHAGSFVLLVDLAALVTLDAPANSGESPDAKSDDRCRRREWSLTAQCPACDSSVVASTATSVLSRAAATRS
ncbi:hypothetical protein [Halomicrococcus sp. NG-SE-24]|uniref:hypothetical protein n=1 Tax=Halomicrococcus sp. NG-SE-24 TaxID=3436928 RepID=UPI003D952EB1